MEKPKRPMSAYMLWLIANRESIKAQYPNMKVTELAKKGGEIWRALDKTEWEEKAAKAKEQYEKDLEKYNANEGCGEASSGERRSSEEQSYPMFPKRQKMVKPIRPMSAYFMWLSNKRESIVAEHPHITQPNVLAKKFGQIWKDLDQQVKKEWEEKAAQAKIQYEKDIEIYNANEGIVDYNKTRPTLTRNKKDQTQSSSISAPKVIV